MRPGCNEGDRVAGEAAATALLDEAAHRKGYGNLAKVEERAAVAVVCIDLYDPYPGSAVERSAHQPFEAYVNGIWPWREEILVYFDQPASNGYAEGVINKAKKLSGTPAGIAVRQIHTEGARKTPECVPWHLAGLA
jgi:hypothetical protein